MENISKTNTMVHTPIIPVSGRLRQVDFKFEGSLCSIADCSVATKVKQRRKAEWRGNTVNLDEESSSAE